MFLYFWAQKCSIYFTLSKVWISIKNSKGDFYLLFNNAFIKYNSETPNEPIPESFKRVAFGTKMTNFSHLERNMNFLKKLKLTNACNGCNACH